MLAVDPQIFSRSFLRCPEHITTQIRNFGHSLSPEYDPVQLAVTPSIGAKPLECFYNVQSQVEAHGGRMAYGWAIWIWPRVFVEAEHHAVWEIGGKMIDVTPRSDGEKRILFLPDPMRAYDFDGNSRIDNIRYPLSPSAAVASLLYWYSERQRFFEANSIGRTTTIDPRTFDSIQSYIIQASALVLIELAQTTGRNDTCICNSGRKFKKCCSPLINRKV
ncbi:SEC-C domain-containing protein [Epibacterium sp. DP7N7-1]|nr:SEC-C domain-containing protein [Epibacterium sp. DP7N7-1]